MRRLYGAKRESLTDGQLDLFEKNKAFSAPEPTEPEAAGKKPAERKKEKAGRQHNWRIFLKCLCIMN
ncbi:transposase [Lacticaseibacillus rhamnosus]|nr:transposase [Lacticaseibacillus rhamnosus]